MECSRMFARDTITSADTDEIVTAIKDAITSRHKSESLEPNFDDTWRRPEIRQHLQMWVQKYSFLFEFSSLNVLSYNHLK